LISEDGVVWTSSWRRGAALIIILALLTPVVAPATAQVSDELVTLQSQVSKLRNEGNYAEAAAAAEHYAALAQERYGRDRKEYATAIAWLASIYEDLGLYAKAESLYKRALDITENAEGCAAELGISGCGTYGRGDQLNGGDGINGASALPGPFRTG
jgi:tetratricopeptide (TPR) repeat protein